MGVPTERLSKLLSLAGPALAPSPVPRPMVLTPLQREYHDLLRERNGFFAFECALHVYSHVESAAALTSWAPTYGELAAGLTFFAQDAFGHQFALSASGVLFFNAETGEKELVASTLEGWADAVLQDYEFYSGWPLAHAWQAEYGPLPVGRRLAPKVPFILGGAYALENLYVATTVELMHFRADLARQLREVADGAQVTLRVTQG